MLVSTPFGSLGASNDILTFRLNASVCCISPVNGVLDSGLLFSRACVFLRVIEATKVCNFKEVKAVKRFVDLCRTPDLFTFGVRHLYGFIDGVYSSLHDLINLTEVTNIVSLLLIDCYLSILWENLHVTEL